MLSWAVSSDLCKLKVLVNYLIPILLFIINDRMTHTSTRPPYRLRIVNSRLCVLGPTVSGPVGVIICDFSAHTSSPQVRGMTRRHLRSRLLSFSVHSMAISAPPGGGRRIGRPMKYSWDDWLNGEEHRLQEGRHFDADPASFRQQVLNEARRRGIKMETTLRRSAADGTWWLRIRSADPATKRSSRGRDWDAIFHSKTPTRLVQGVHFNCKVESMRVQAYQAAKRRGVDIKTEIENSSVIITPQRKIAGT